MSGRWRHLFVAGISLALPSSAYNTGVVPKSATAQHLNMRSSRSSTLNRGSRSVSRARPLYVEPPPGGVSVEGETTETASQESPPIESSSEEGSDSSEPSKREALPFQDRGKVNEIDFCMSPSDVSLSRLSGTAARPSLPTPTPASSSASEDNEAHEEKPRILSLTRALNSASNRAVRRILLSRSWPSAESLNISLRRVLARGVIATDTSKPAAAAGDGGDANLKTEGSASGANGLGKMGRRGRSDKEWVDDQIAVFRESYGALPGYEYADAYLECILSLATTGLESPRVTEVISGGVYDDSYRRVISVLKSVGTVFEEVPVETPSSEQMEDTDGNTKTRVRIGQKLLDQDICWSMMDKISIRKEKLAPIAIAVVEENEKDEEKEEVDETSDVSSSLVEEEVKREQEDVAAVEEEGVVSLEEPKVKAEKNGIQKMLSFLNIYEKTTDTTDKIAGEVAIMEEDAVKSKEDDNDETKQEEVAMEEEEVFPGVLVSEVEPTMTRQLNVLSNIVKRCVLFGGDNELLVLTETLEADRAPFIRKWYPGTNDDIQQDLKQETRPGVQYFNCLVQLLKDCYQYGVLTDISPSLPLASSYANSYERLTALLVELGSGYIKPISVKTATDGNLLSAKSKPKTPTEEFVRFSQLEFALRRTTPDTTDYYPDDLIGTWRVSDQIEGKVIGTSTVVFNPEGELYVPPPLRGLSWRLDPGPTHLDTCTFQVLSEDGAILQYRGFMDRGARIESRFSKRGVKIRGAVTFQMRDGLDVANFEGGRGALDVDKRDILPVTIETGTTRFVMSKVFDLGKK